MGIVKAFKALNADQQWFEQLLQHPQQAHAELKHSLEGRGALGIGTGDVEQVDKLILSLLQSTHYLQQDIDAMYIYEQETHRGTQLGIWLLTAVQDLIDGTILTHEETLIDREKRLAAYRAAIGLEGSPVLLSYQANERIDSIFQEIIDEQQPLQYQEEGKVHRIWKVTQKEKISELVILFKHITSVYVGDGHHRLAAAARMQAQSPQWVMALYVNTVQLHISAFTRLILPVHNFNELALMEALHHLFTMLKVPGNAAFVPARLHQFGLLIAGQWYQLDLKPEFYSMPHLADVIILQEKLLAPVLGITEPKSDPRLVCHPLDDLNETIQQAKEAENAILFVLYPMKAAHLLEHADKGISLPPKSSFIEPKVPYGMVLNAEAVLARASVKELIKGLPMF